MLTKQFTKSQVLLDKDTHWTMSIENDINPWIPQTIPFVGKYSLQKLLPLAQLYYVNRKSGLIVTLNNFE